MIWSRLNPLRLIILTLLVGVTGACQAQPRSGSPDAEPAGVAEGPTNVVFFLVDDLGWADLGYSGSSFYQTPNIDRLAASGMVFTDAYAACPVCSPTRASIMAGKTPARMDTTDWFGAPQHDWIMAAIERGDDNRWTRYPVVTPNYVPQLPHEEHTLAEAFKDAGYATFFAGKWHLGGDGFGPLTQGFDINIGGFHRGGPYGGGKYFHPFTGMPNLTSEEGDHLPARLAEETADFITAHKDEPFLAYLSFYSVHTPLIGRPDLVEHYRELKSRMRIAGPLFGPEGERQVRLVQEHAVYAAMVTAMDEAVGHVLDTLEEEGLADNTIVVFSSDNGGAGYIGIPDVNAPYRGWKITLFEGGIRVPLMMRWPDRIPAGKTIPSPVAHIDVMPTLVAAGEGTIPGSIEIDGKDLLPLATGATTEDPHEAIFWTSAHYRVVRKDDWKLQLSERPKKAWLFNLADDPTEQTNLADASSDPTQPQKMRAAAASRLTANRMRRAVFMS